MKKQYNCRDDARVDNEANPGEWAPTSYKREQKQYGQQRPSEDATHPAHPSACDRKRLLRVLWNFAISYKPSDLDQVLP